MLRFSKNRWWAFVLTLLLFTACFCLLTTQAPTAARADSGPTITPEDPPPSYGDPDVPTGPGNGKAGMGVAHGGRIQGVSPSGTPPPGEGTTPVSVSMMRLHLFLLVLRSWLLRF